MDDMFYPGIIASVNIIRVKMTAGEKRAWVA
jgi:hypothetical protein